MKFKAKMDMAYVLISPALEVFFPHTFHYSWALINNSSTLLDTQEKPVLEYFFSKKYGLNRKKR